jgi:hypothetical protein
LELRDALVPFFARTLADRGALAALAALLFGAWWAMRALGDRPARALFLACSAMFVGFLAARVLAAPFVLLALAIVLRASLRRAAGWRGSAGIAGIAVCVLTWAIAGARAPESPPVATSAAQETTAARERNNLFEARLWAERWVTESAAGNGGRGPGDAALVLAQIDWELGHRTRARSLAADVAARGADADVRRRASEKVGAWDARNEPGERHEPR